MLVFPHGMPSSRATRGRLGWKCTSLDDCLGLIAETGYVPVDHCLQRRVFLQGRCQVAIDPGYGFEDLVSYCTRCG